uniref:DNA 5'-3' helicase n=1 Tax=Vertebrata lanosa TaxID=1261582 RepID=A0A0B5VUM1_9FLOR|nr:replicative DNA helicase [Vertebrata lanosa]AJH65888.1 replicative DNA helicase [Vertebrata lanosa]
MHNFYRYKFIPQNYLAEETLIGIILIYPQITYKIVSLAEENIFFIEANKIIYLKITKIIKYENHTLVSLLYELKYENLLRTIGGVNRLIQLMKQSQIFMSSYKTNRYVEDLITLLNKNYLKRLIIQLGYSMIKMGYIVNTDSKYIYEKILSYLKNIEKQIAYHKNDKVSNIKDIISTKLLQVKYKKIDIEDTAKIKKVKSGFIKLDKIIRGLPIGNLIVIAGRPAVGKTSLTINIAYYCFYIEKVSILIFSLEMSLDQIFDKFISISSDNNTESQSITKLKDEHWNNISQICHGLLKQNIYINEEINLNITQIEYISQNLRKKQSIELIIVDYLQLIEMSTENQKIQNRSQELGYITRRLKLLAQNIKIPIIVISQLNRNIENRNDKEPVLSDLKESGCILYKNSIALWSKYLKQTNVKNVSIYNKLLSRKAENYVTKFLIRISNKINILNKYIFLHIIQRNFIGLTFNHKFLNKNSWVKSSQLSKTTLVFNKRIKNYKINTQTYLKNVIFKKYEKIYDVYAKNYFNLIIQKINIHNSIEQDADIIIILYEMNIKNNTTNIKDKIINLKVSKNRNGKTGYCKLKFKLDTNTFQDIDLN